MSGGGKGGLSNSGSGALPPLPPNRRPPKPGGPPKGPAPLQRGSGGDSGAPKPQSATWRMRQTASTPKLQPLQSKRGGSLPPRRQKGPSLSEDPIICGAEEVYRVGPWSVRKMPGPDVRLIFVHTKERRVEVQPPPEVLAALHLHSDGTDDGQLEQQEDSEGEVVEQGSPETRASSSPVGSPAGTAHAVEAASPSRGATPPSPTVEEDTASCASPTQSPHGSRPESPAVESPRFQRILLGAGSEVPLKMARDILEVLREDASIFPEVQKRFSERKEEPDLRLGEEGGLGEELQSEACLLAPGELSDILATEAGMQILIRVA